MKVFVTSIKDVQEIDWSKKQLVEYEYGDIKKGEKVIILTVGRHGTEKRDNCYEGIVMYSTCLSYPVGLIKDNFAKNCSRYFNESLEVTMKN